MLDKDGKPDALHEPPPFGGYKFPTLRCVTSVVAR